jgi:type II secretory pathway predicted ATPase ExeA
MERAIDPFGDTCDPRLYVPRAATEEALAALRASVAAGRGVTVLSGPAGLGKTMLLRVLATQLVGARCVYLGYPSLGIEELARVALDALGELADPSRAAERLAAAAQRGPGSRVVLLVDDASALPLPTARALRAIVNAAGASLQLVAAAVDDARALGVIAALGADVLEVRLRQPLTRDELREYVRIRVERTRSSAGEEALRDEQIEWLVAESAGIPRLVNLLATSLLSTPRLGLPLELFVGDAEADADPHGSQGAADSAASAAPREVPKRGDS